MKSRQFAEKWREPKIMWSELSQIQKDNPARFLSSAEPRSDACVHKGVCVIKLEREWRETEDEILRDQQTESNGTHGHTKLFLNIFHLWQ